MRRSGSSRPASAPRSRAYFTSTAAPCSSSLALIAAASSFDDAGLHGLRRAVDEVLRFLEAEAGQLAHDLDDLDLLRAGFLERRPSNSVCSSAAGSRRRTSATSRRSRADRGGRDRDVELAS